MFFLSIFFKENNREKILRSQPTNDQLERLMDDRLINHNNQYLIKDEWWEVVESYFNTIIMRKDKAGQHLIEYLNRKFKIKILSKKKKDEDGKFKNAWVNITMK